MKYFTKRLIFIWQRHFWIWLLVTILISYGQILSMSVWQDDNALFFKLAHIKENAGFLGPGLFGAGTYKYTAFVYFPIYYFFGHNVLAYFIYMLIGYLLATWCVYYAFTKILGSLGGRVAGILFAAGYISSDGFIRIFNSIPTSLSIILISLMFLSLWQYYHIRRIRWYLLALIFFVLASELIPARTHYLIGVVVFFGLIFSVQFKNLKWLFNWFCQTLPFLLLFYFQFVKSADHRSSLAPEWVVSLLHGQFYKSYSLLSSLSNLILPDWWKGLYYQHLPLGIPSYWLLVAVSWFSIVLWISRLRYRILLVPGYSLALLVWALQAKRIFATQIYNLKIEQVTAAWLGGVIVMVLPLVFFSLKKTTRKIFLILICWILINIAAYSAYSPDVMFLSNNRYLAHSFLALVGIFGLIASQLNFKNYSGKIVIGLIILYGLGNLYYSIYYQHQIVITRSQPARQFYQSLQSYVPELKKKSLLYIDVAPESQGNYREAFSVAQMPETTAIAWRYGLDRYDLSLFTNFDEMKKYVLVHPTSLDQVYAFWYSKDGLIDTTKVLRSELKLSEPLFEVKNSTASSNFNTKNPPIQIDRLKISSVIPVQLKLKAIAKVPDFEELKFPFRSDNLKNINQISRDEQKRDMAIQYYRYKSDFNQEGRVIVNNYWQDRTVKNLTDGDFNTAWQADRVKWKKEKGIVTLRLDVDTKVSRLVWVNGFANNTPTNYTVEVSSDGVSYQVVKTVTQNQRLEPNILRVEQFIPVAAKFVRLVISNTLNNDAPAISEIWVVPADLAELDVNQAEYFIAHPFEYIPTQTSFSRDLEKLNYTGHVQLFWKNDKYNDYQFSSSSKLDIIYDNQEHDYQVVIPAGGLKIDAIKLDWFSIPGDVIIKELSFWPVSVEGIK